MLHIHKPSGMPEPTKTEIVNPFPHTCGKDGDLLAGIHPACVPPTL